MQPDDEVCLCFHVSQRKIVSYLRRENPPVASLISECLGAGTGCGWCVPFLRRLHALHHAGAEPDLPLSPAEYANRRSRYRRTGLRDVDGAPQAPGESDGESSVGPPADGTNANETEGGHDRAGA